MSSIGKIAPLMGLLCAMLAFAQKAEQNSPPTSSANSQTLRVDVDLVLLNVTVTDSHNRYITGLQKEYFQVWEDKVEQQIEYFSAEDVALSVGIIFDASGSMKNVISPARSAAVTFLRMGSPEDEYFLIEFNDAPRLAQDFTKDIGKLQNRLAFTTPRGSTSLYDAVYLGLDRVVRGTNTRKALLLVSDGMDNRSRYSFSHVKEFAKERDVQIYAIGIVDQWSAQQGYTYNGRGVIEELTNLTGGRAFFPESVQKLEDICEKIGLDLKNQYVLGYRSSNQTSDGKWRKTKVKVSAPKGIPRLSVRAKTGYYAPTLMKAMK